jgi:hypothetical protein
MVKLNGRMALTVLHVAVEKRLEGLRELLDGYLILIAIPLLGLAPFAVFYGVIILGWKFWIIIVVLAVVAGIQNPRMIRR